MRFVDSLSINLEFTSTEYWEPGLGIEINLARLLRKTKHGGNYELTGDEDEKGVYVMDNSVGRSERGSPKRSMQISE